MTTFEMVKEFHQMVGIPIGESPRQIDRHAFARRARLIAEEFSEYCKAVSEGNIVEIADALADLKYVVDGAAVEHGLPFDEVFRQVHESNMTKAGGHFDTTGKWVKPPTYIPVNLSWLKALEK